MSQQENQCAVSRGESQRSRLGRPPGKRQVVLDGPVARVELTRGLFTVIDAADVALVTEHNWLAVGGKKGFYAACAMRIDGRYRTIYLHRFLMGVGEADQVDHRDRDKLNNRRENLRWCTISQNAANKSPRRALPVGVNPSGRAWSATIGAGGKLVQIGRFATLEDASAARDAEARALHGEFAVLNQPDVDRSVAPLPRLRGPRLDVAIHDLDEAIRRHVELVLGLCDGNRSHAAEVLGVDRRTMYRMITRYDLETKA